MRHSFNVELAKKLGVLEAILLENIYFWIEKNKSNNKHFYDGKYWTYNSRKAFTEIFPYATERKIQLALERLEKCNLIVTGNYNKFANDRTKWFSITEDGLNELTKCTITLNKMFNKNEQNVQPLPDNKPDIYYPPIIPQGKKEDKNESENEDDSEEASNNKELIETVIDYLNKKGNTTFKATNKRTVSLINARVRQGYTLDDFKDVIWHCYCEWVQEPFKFKNGKMSDTYFRPSTLFNETNFENYLQEYRRLYDE